jgi:hypothetical protein
VGNSLNESRVCGDAAGHDAEAFLLAGSVMCGCWEAAGLMPELDGRGGVWGWKVMRCGCRFVVLMYGAGSVPSSSSISASVRTVAASGSRPPVAPPSERPEGVGSSTVPTASADRRENDPRPVTPSRFQSMGSGGPA